MNELSLASIKKIQLDILEDVAKFCKNNNIKYTLYFGSLLGAVRHGGYIPWDDDIDIAMPRVYYQRFIRDFSKSYPHYNILKYDIDKKVYTQFAKVSRNDTVLLEDADIEYELGVNIDVFPIDGIPSGFISRFVILGVIKFFHRIMAIKTIRVGPRFRSKSKNIILTLLKLVFLCITKAQVAKILHRIISCISSDSSDLALHICFDQFGLRDNYVRDWFEDTEIIRFENLSVSAIRERDRFLKTHYGDYMALPPLDKRVTHHMFKAYKKG